MRRPLPLWRNDGAALAVIVVERPGADGLGLLQALHHRVQRLPSDPRPRPKTSSRRPRPEQPGLDCWGAEDHLTRSRWTLRKSWISSTTSLLGALGQIGRAESTERRERVRPDEVSCREREISFLLAEGVSQPEIAAAPATSPKTVATHIQNVLRKPGVHSRTQGACFCLP